MTQAIKFHFAKPDEIPAIAKFHSNASCTSCTKTAERKKRQEWIDNAHGIKDGSYKILVMSKTDKPSDMLGYMAFEDNGDIVRLKEVCTIKTKYNAAEMQFEKMMAFQLRMYLQTQDGKSIYGQPPETKPSRENLKNLLVLSTVPRHTINN